MVNDYFDVFLDSVGNIFIEPFCINVRKGNYFEVLFLVWPLCSLGISIIVTSSIICSTQPGSGGTCL